MANEFIGIKFILLSMFLSIGVLSPGQTQVRTTINCGQSDLAIGLFPRIVVDEEKMVIKIEHAGLPFIDYYSFSDTIKSWTDTLENEIAKKEIFINASSEDLEWIAIDSLKKIEAEDLEFDLNEYPNQQVLLIDEINYTDEKGYFVFGKAAFDNFSGGRELAFYVDTYLPVGGQLTYIEECGTAIETEVERIYISDGYYNEFPIILIQHAGREPQRTKRLRLIFNIGTSSWER